MFKRFFRFPLLIGTCFVTHSVVVTLVLDVHLLIVFDFQFHANIEHWYLPKTMEVAVGLLVATAIWDSFADSKSEWTLYRVILISSNNYPESFYTWSNDAVQNNI